MEEEYFESLLPLNRKEVDTLKNADDVDLCNDETFGVGDSISDLNDDWEKHHESLAKLLELEHEKVKKSSPMRIHNSIDTSNSSDSTYEKSFVVPSNKHGAFSSSDEDEENIIGSSISQLRMDDDSEFLIKNNAKHVRGFEFQESEESWNSPSRGNNQQSDSLHELISPGDSVWASPSRSVLADHIVPQIDVNPKNAEGEEIMKKLFGGRDIMQQTMNTPDVPRSKAIHLEDLERGLPTSPSPSITPAKPVGTPAPPGFLPMGMNQSPHFPIATPPGIPLVTMGLDGNTASPALFSPLPLDMASLLLLNKQAMQLRGGTPPNLPPMLSPQYLAAAHARMASPESFLWQSPRNNSGNQRWKGNRGSHRGSYNRNFRHGEKTWHRYPKQVNTDMKEQQEFMSMKPSKMMTSKEKEWIFKISLMSLLSGDPNITDYYFVSYMNKKMLENAKTEDETKAANEETSDNLEKTKKLMTYAQKNQQAKESYKPVKFEGSLGKLSITSVHHPRQIMDLSITENDNVSRGTENKKKRFVLYGIVEKLYDLLLNIQDVEHRFIEASSEEQEEIMKERNQDINKMFQLLRIKLHTLDEESENDQFLQLMTITKARKFLCRSFSLFFPIQSESIFLAFLQILPILLRKDAKENVLMDLKEKMEEMLRKCNEAYKTKVVQTIVKLNLKSVLCFQTGCSLLVVILRSVQQQSSFPTEWAELQTEIARELLGLSDDIKTRNKKEIHELLHLLHNNQQQQTS